MTHWITHSEPSASRLADLLQSLGHSVLCESVTAILRLTPSVVPQTLNKSLQKPDLIIALSQHATSAYLESFFLPAHKDALVLAIGPSTAAGFKQSGKFTVKMPTQSNSEGLLSMPEIQALLPEKTVWLLTGEGGRDLVAESLQTQCRLVRFDLYRREKRVPSFPANISFRAIWVGSIHAVQQTDVIARDWQIDRHTTTLVVASARVAEYARGLGWDDIIICDTADLQAVRQTCARIEHGE